MKVVARFRFSYFPRTTVDDSGAPFPCQPMFERHEDAASPILTNQMTRGNERPTTNMNLQQMKTRSSNDTTRKQSRMALHWFFMFLTIKCIYLHMNPRS